jgi:hypothetical protein
MWGRYQRTSSSSCVAVQPVSAAQSQTSRHPTIAPPPLEHAQGKSWRELFAVDPLDDNEDTIAEAPLARTVRESGVVENDVARLADQDSPTIPSPSPWQECGAS